MDIVDNNNDDDKVDWGRHKQTECTVSLKPPPPPNNRERGAEQSSTTSHNNTVFHHHDSSSDEMWPLARHRWLNEVKKTSPTYQFLPIVQDGAKPVVPNEEVDILCLPNQQDKQLGNRRLHREILDTKQRLHELIDLTANLQEEAAVVTKKNKKKKKKKDHRTQSCSNKYDLDDSSIPYSTIAVCGSSRKEELIEEFDSHTNTIWSPTGDRKMGGSRREGSTSREKEMLKRQGEVVANDTTSKATASSVERTRAANFQNAKVEDPETYCNAVARLKRDLTACQSGSVYGIVACPIDDENMFGWSAYILGPKSTIWEGGKFRLFLKFPGDYPFRPPQVTVTTPMFHPNICPTSGKIYMDILGDGSTENLARADCGTWSPAWCASSVLMSIQSLLDDPNPRNSVNVMAADLYKDRRYEYQQRVNQLVEESKRLIIPCHLDRMMQH